MSKINLRTTTSFISEIFKNEVDLITKNEFGCRTRIQSIAWPSECLAQLGSIPIGECKRSMFYKIIGSTPTEPMSVTGKYICDAGNMYEDFHIDKAKKMGMYVADQIKVDFELPNSRNKIVISGRMDLILEHNGKKKSIEIKSISAYKAPKIMGNQKSIPLPANNNLMQAMLYYYFLNETDLGKAMDVDEVYLQYVNRSDNSVFYFKVALDEEGYPIITAINQCGQELSCIKLRDVKSYDELLLSSTVTDEESRLASLRVSIFDIFNKFEEVYDHVSLNSLPSKDYTLVYNSDEVEREYKLGRISKIKYNKYKKGEPLGDNKCAYCMFKTKCMNDSGIVLG